MGLFLKPHRRAAVLFNIFICVAQASAAPVSHTASGEQAPAFPNAFRATSHRSFEDVEKWRKVFDDASRNEWQRPADVVAALEIASGSVVVDLGAGTGYFTHHLSRAVGLGGSVLAVETEPNMVAALRVRAEQEGLRNVTPILGSFDDPRVPAGVADLILIVDTFHHIDQRLEYFRALKRALRPRGRIAIIDWKKEPLPVGPELAHKLAREQVIYEMTAADYALAREPDLLPYQYFLIFRPAER